MRRFHLSARLFSDSIREVPVGPSREPGLRLTRRHPIREVVIVEAVRSPIGKREGKLSAVLPVHLAARIFQALIARAGIDAALVQDVILGCVTPLGEQGANIARLAVLQAGLPVQVPAVTINRMCGSSQQAIHFAAQEILSGDMDVVIAGGIEMMSRVPLGSDWPQEWPPDFPYALIHQGLSAELMAEKWKLTRSELDRFAFESHVKAAAATRRGDFSREIVPIDVALPEGKTETLTVDEGIRFEPDLVKMGKLQPAFKPDGVITAGNSSQISDGAAALLLMSADKAAQLRMPAPRQAGRSRCRRLRSGVDAFRADSRHAPGARPRQAQARRYGCD